MRRWFMIAASLVCFGLLIGGCASHSNSVIQFRDPDSEGSRVIDETLDIATGELMGTPKEEEKPLLPVVGVSGEPVPTFDDIDDLPYLIEAGDELEFRSFDDPSLSQQVVVRYDGHISLPMVPDLKVQDLTREEATELVRDAYTEVFRDPQISLAITATTSKTYHVMGDVQDPREFPYTKPISVLDAINQAGGPRVNQRGGDSFVGSRGALTQALIIRRYGGDRDVIECDLSNYREPEVSPADTLVLPSDIVYVPEGINLVYVLGEVRGPDVYQLMEDTTLLHLLTRAGGFNETTGRVRQVVLIREMEEDLNRVFLVDVRQILKTGQDITMKPGDIVYIPQKPLVRLQQFVGRFVGSITPLMGLYRQAYDTYYTDRRYDALFETGDATTAELLTILDSVRSFGTLTTSIPTP
ncbi:MAG: SLBB domain-containing protein [Candidatus Hydrogenedentota bacterium]